MRVRARQTSRLPIATAIAVALAVAPVRAQIDDAGLRQFTAGTVAVDGVEYPYRLLEPLAEQRARPQPLVVFLHGAGERGDDNRKQLHWLGKDLVQPEARRRWPCFLLAVQCPKDERWVDASWRDVHGPRMQAEPTRALRAVQRMVEQLRARPDVDRGRVYLTGLSMGGMGVWDLATRDAHVYAAAQPICGGGDPTQVHRLIGLPLDVWHGAEDRTVAVERSREMVDALTELGFPPQYHELQGVGHDVWKPAYGDDGGLAWLFAQDQRQQRRGEFAELAVVPRCDVATRAEGVFQVRSSTRVHAPEELRELVRYLFDTLELRGAQRPGFVDDVAVADNDLVFALDEQLPHVFSIEAGSVLRVTARDAAGMRQALAAVHQALRTLPALAMPRGSFAHDRRPAKVRVELRWTRFRWSRDALDRLLRQCFLANVAELSFGGGDEVPADEQDLAEVQERAALLGMTWTRSPSELDGAVVVRDVDGIGAVLSRQVERADAGFLVRLDGSTPDVVLRRLRLLLPAAVARANQPDRPVHVHSFVSRIAVRWR